MGFIPTITCKKCNQKYSAIRSRCPRCGTRKTNQSERTPASSASVRKGSASNARANANVKWQFIFTLIMLFAVILSVIVLITVNLDGENTEPTMGPTLEPLATPSPTPPPTPPPTPTVTAINITHLGVTKPEFAMHIGDADIQLKAEVYPLDAIGAVVVWSSSDTSICTVTDNGLVKAVGSGWVNIYAECGAIKQVCKVLVF